MNKINLIPVLYIIICVTVFMQSSIFSQNITNTLGSTGTFSIKDGSTNYFTLNQSTGNVSLFRNMELGGISTSSSTRGVITKNGVRFLHNYGSENTFLGLNSGNYVMNGYSNTAVGSSSLFSNSAGYQNSAFGNYSLFSNTNGLLNSAFGSYSLYTNTVGNYNSAFGSSTLQNNTTGRNNSSFGVYSLFLNSNGNFNSAFGFSSLYENTTGNNNSAFGLYSLFNNDNGYSNSAFGNYSLYSNWVGVENSAFGVNSLRSNQTGSWNSAFGYNSGFSMRMGNYNSTFGYNSGSNIQTGSNNTCIGYDAQLSNGDGSNEVRIGNTSVMYASIQVAWSITSDRNLKKNILNSNLGLGFISKLRPVSYIRKNDESEKTEYGLIAQEVEETLKQEGVENTGMLTVTDNGEYQLRYNDLLAPMIKAIQELKAEKDTEIASLKNENEMLKNQINEIYKTVNELKLNRAEVTDIKLNNNGK